MSSSDTIIMLVLLAGTVSTEIIVWFVIDARDQILKELRKKK